MTEAEPVWPVMVEVREVYVVGVKAPSQHEACAIGSTELSKLIHGQDAVEFEITPWPPSPQEREIYKEEIEYECDDTNF